VADPTLVLNDTMIELGDTIKNMLQPLAKKVADVLEPVRPTINTLFDPLEPFSEFIREAGGPSETNLVDIVQYIAEGLSFLGGQRHDAEQHCTKQFPTAFKNVFKVLDAIETVIDFIDQGEAIENLCIKSRRD
jgi:hypothetical protein